MATAPPKTTPPVSAPASPKQAVAWVRYPADLARAIVAAGVTALVAAYAVVWPSGASGISERVVGLVDDLPPVVAGGLVGMIQVAAVVVPLGVVVVSHRGRWRERIHALGAGLLTLVIGVLLDGALEDSVPTAVSDAADEPSWVTGSAFPSGAYLAAVAAVVTVLAPTLARGWRRILWWSVGLVAVARVVTAVETPIGVIALISAGVFVGSVVMAVFKVPLRSPSPEAVRRALVAAGLDVEESHLAETGARHGPTYLADGPHQSWFVKLVGRDERNAELMARAVRALRVDAPDDRRTTSAVETIEHEALGLGLAARAGAAVPAVVAVGRTDERAAVLVMERVAGDPLASVDPLGPEVLAGAFATLAALHRARIAHGWASLNHFLVDDQGEVVLVDLRWSSPAASEELLAADLAELLASAAARVGVAEAVRAAATAFDEAALGASLPMIQPLAISPESRKALRGRKGLLGELRDEVQAASGVETYEMAELERLSWRKALTFVGGLVMAFLLLAFIGNASSIWDALKEVDPVYLPLLAVLALLPYPAGALSLLGAVNVSLRYWRTAEVMFAQSFLNKFTPANAGGMALRTRYLQRNGVSLVTAASAIGITSGASGVMQVVMAFTFFTWAGSDDTGGSFSLPSLTSIAIIVVLIAVALGIAWATTWGRRNLLKAWESIVSAAGDVRELATQPTKLLLLFGGAGLAKLGTILALAQTMRAFGLEVDFPALGAMYITATTVAAAAPTPGGVGAIEAALTAGLIGLGVDAGQAAAVVLVFRTFTYWLPIAPCWGFFQKLQHEELL